MTVGTEEGDVCGRDGCEGVMVEESPYRSESGCSCHISPPCWFCMSVVAHCPVCDHFEPGPND